MSTQQSLSESAATTTERRQFRDSDARDDEMGEAIEEWAEELIDGAQDAAASDEFQEWLDAQAQFSNLSWRNTLLIKMQKPDATKVATFNTWLYEFDRNVKEGEKALWIWEPMYRDTVCPKCGNTPGYHDREHVDCDNHEEGTPEEWDGGVVGFKPGARFDISQTEGEPVPELDTDAAAGDVADPEGLLAATVEAGESLPVPTPELVAPEDYSRSGHGATEYDPQDGATAIKVEDRDPAATVSTTVHEYAHALAHDAYDDDSREAQEVEAEATAYVVGRHFGLDVSGSENYLAMWSDADAEEVRGRLARISTNSRRIIEAIEDAQE
jgi:hypothetical protein